MRLTHRCPLVAILSAALLLLLAPNVVAPSSALAQNTAAVASGGTRAFVTSVIPVIGRNGVVGGIDVDPDGVLRVAEQVPAIAGDNQAGTRQRGAANELLDRPLRKISLSRLDAAIAQRALAGEPLEEAMVFLANLLRVEYVFVYPERHDIVIAGPASETPQLVGDARIDPATMLPILRLDDLVDALQSNHAALSGGRVFCSIDPTPEGTTRLQAMLNRGRVKHNNATLRRMEQQLGHQVISVGGVRPASHFARVLVGADYTMKRLAMGLVSSPVREMPSYMSLLRRTPNGTAIASPRFWLTAHYDRVQQSDDGLAWHFQGAGLQAKTEDGHVNANGELVSEGQPGRLGQQWADRFTESYAALSRAMPIFGQLAGCVDATVLAALIHRQDLRMIAGCPLSTLMDADKLVGQVYPVPTRVPSMASAARTGGVWIVGVSGGVELDPSRVLGRAIVTPSLADKRQLQWSDTQDWWWDE